MNANPRVLDFQEARSGYESNARARRAARENLTKALRNKAQAEHDYRKALSVAFAKHRSKGEGVGEAEIHAKAEAASYALSRDMADAEAKGASARLAELEGERASLRQLVDFSQAVSGVGS